MNWRGWFNGLLVSIFTGILMALTAWQAVPNVTGKQLLFLIGIPMITNFLAFIKQTPLPGSVINKVIAAIMVIGLLFSLGACATLQQKWDKATDDEKARIVVSQTQSSLKLAFVASQTFVASNPKYKDEWKNKVLPMFEAANNILGDIIKKGQAGQKITYMEVLAAVGGRITDIMAVINKWGVKTVLLEYNLALIKSLA